MAKIRVGINPNSDGKTRVSISLSSEVRSYLEKLSIESGQSISAQLREEILQAAIKAMPELADRTELVKQAVVTKLLSALPGSHAHHMHEIRKVVLDNLQLQQWQDQSLGKTWALYWIATPIAYLFPKADREEWLGDLREMHYELVAEARYPQWIVNTITIGRTLILVWSAIEVRVLGLASRLSGPS